MDILLLDKAINTNSINDTLFCCIIIKGILRKNYRSNAGPNRKRTDHTSLLVRNTQQAHDTNLTKTAMPNLQRRQFPWTQKRWKISTLSANEWLDLFLQSRCNACEDRPLRLSHTNGPPRRAAQRSPSIPSTLNPHLRPNRCITTLTPPRDRLANTTRAAEFCDSVKFKRIQLFRD